MASATATPTGAPDRAAAVPVGATVEPRGFPIAPGMRLGLVVGERGGRQIVWGAGPAVDAYSREDQPAADPERANRAGWNCRTHVAYEGVAAVDWYIPTGTPIRATMDGTATLYVITVRNAFDHYGVAREPYLGNPDRARAPLSPFPGPGGGKGVYVLVANAQFATEYAHLEVTATVSIIPRESFLPGFAPESAYEQTFAAMRDFRSATPVARWQVRRGDLVGYSGDSGYSEAPHLHYTVSRAGSPLLCPTGEAGFLDGGWLFR